MSAFGHWIVQDSLPAFTYTAHPSDPMVRWDPVVREPTDLHWVVVGNRRLKMVPYNDGTVCLWDEAHCLRWIVAPAPSGSGTSRLKWGTDQDVTVVAGAPGKGLRPTLTFGPTWFRNTVETGPVRIERTMLCPEGEHPWILIRVRLTLAEGARPDEITHVEEWALRPRWLNVADPVGAEEATSRATFETGASGGTAWARERSTPWGPPYHFVLEAIDETEAQATVEGGHLPTLRLETLAHLRPASETTLWFRFGVVEAESVRPDSTTFEQSLEGLRRRAPTGTAGRAPEAQRELPWHAALLTGGACRDLSLGGHSLNQGSTYSFDAGFNGAARDPLQHALPLVYSEPDLALSVLRNTCSWGSPDGDLPYALDGSHQPFSMDFRPSDQQLWALWLAAEYAAATGDLAAFDQKVSYHPAHHTGEVTLAEHLRRQFDFFSENVGRGERGHIRVLNSDWNDVFLDGLPRDVMSAKGESVLNSAMAAWVLPVYAGLSRRLGDEGAASQADRLAGELRDAVRDAWNGRWFQRGYGPGLAPIGDDECWLEVQPWAILCGAASDEQAEALLDLIDRGHRAGSPLGARLVWPIPTTGDPLSPRRIVQAGAWFAINMTLAWAARRLRPELAWGSWRQMTLSQHTRAYPGIWEGTLSGPDCYNSPETDRPGHTWVESRAGWGMQNFPVGNLHSHAQPLLGYLRLLGAEPAPDGSLAVVGGGHFRSPTFAVNDDGSGFANVSGPVTIVAPQGVFRGGPGEITWP